MKKLSINPRTGVLEAQITFPVDVPSLSERLLRGKVRPDDVDLYTSIVGCLHDLIKPAHAPFSRMRYMRHNVNVTDYSVTFTFFDSDKGVEVEERRTVQEVVIWIAACLEKPLIP